MKLVVDFGSWTTMKAATIMVAGALAIAGTGGTAVAISPTLDAPIRWQGGWEQFLPSVAAGGHEVAVVPAGRNLLITDIVAANQTSSAALFSIYLGSADCSVNLKNRLLFVLVPPINSVHLPLETGIGFSAGQRICVAPTGTLNFNFRGFLFTPAPAS